MKRVMIAGAGCAARFRYNRPATMAVYSLGERRVSFHGKEWFIAENATVIGSVILHDQASVRFNAVVRGDNDIITIGERSNIQDPAVLHVDPGVPLTLRNNVSVGHQPRLHGCTVGDRTLVGIAAVPEAVPISDELSAELDRRLAEFEANPEAGSPWEEVRTRILRGTWRTG